MTLGLALPAFLLAWSVAAPNLYISAGERRDGQAAQTRWVALNVTNTGANPARDVRIDAVSPIEVLGASPSSVTLLSTLPAQLRSINPNTTATTWLLFRWPAAAQHIRVVVHCSTANGSYQISTTLTLAR